jgi:AcrR family transcriptional regulator/transcriptional regulator with XRE-family HTH domain
MEGRRLQNRISTEREIRDAAFALFAATGYEATTIDEIAVAAGVARRTVFRYYASKEAIVFGDVDGRLRRLREALAEHHVEGEPPFVSMGRALLVFLAELEDDADLVAAQGRLALANPVLIRRSREISAECERILYEELQRRFAGQSDAPDFLALQVSAGIGVALMFAALRTWYFEHQRLPLTAVFIQAYERMYDAIVPFPPDVAQDRATTELERRTVVQSAIDARMAEVGLSAAADLASKSGLSIPTIQRLMAGRSRPHTSTLIQISKALEWPPETLAEVVAAVPGAASGAERAIEADTRLNRKDKERLLTTLAELLGKY